jgi:diphthine-ammonia ligase
MIDSGMEAILVKVAGAGLVPEKHLGTVSHLHSLSPLHAPGKTLATLAPVIARLHEKYELDYCGEGGEYESFVTDCSLFRTQRIKIIQSEVVLDDEDPSVGNLRIIECQLVEKNSVETIDHIPSSPHSETQPVVSGLAHSSLAIAVPRYSSTSLSRPEVLLDSDGYFQSPLLYPDPSSTTLPPTLQDSETVAVDQLTDLFYQLTRLIESLPPAASASLSDAVFVHLYLADMTLFGTINSRYCSFFDSTKYPPSRVCVAVGVHLDAFMMGSL